ncbi:MAG: glycosyltransferase family 39 protein [Thermoanaerobaculia bacterium]
MSLRSLFPLALFVGVRVLADARRSGRAAFLLRLPVRLLLFIAAATGTTWWFFSSLELLPFVLAGALPPWLWARARLPRAFESAWAPVLAAALLVFADWAASSRLDVAAAAFLVLAAAIVTLPSPFAPEGKEWIILESRWVPALLGLVSALIVLRVWGSLAEPPSNHDEASYLLQAICFAHGRWAWPSPALPQFFEQLHVLLVPAVASKYMPGHALLVSVGTLLGLPGLVPLALTGVTGGLLYCLARRLAGVWAALLTWLLWSTAPGNLEWRSSYLSETTTAALWLLGWWALWRWSEREKSGDLLLVAACVGWGAITRPLTGLVFAVPVAAFVLWRAWARRLWKQVAAAAGLGVLVLGIIPVWSAATTGNWRTTPLLLYTRQYMPYDVPGFGPGSARPERALPPELDRLNQKLERTRDNHTVDRVAGVAADRWNSLLRKTFGERRGFLLVFALLGALSLPAPWRFALATAVLLLAAYLTYWPASYWGVYYIEAYPVLFLAAGAGLWRFGGSVARALAIERPARAWRAEGVHALLAAAATVLLAATVPAYMRGATELRARSIASKAAFSAAIAATPERRAVVFVRYTPTHDGNQSFVESGGDFRTARVWVAHDRGAENRLLLEAAPDRVPYLFDEASGRLCRLDAGSPARASPGCD